MPTSAGAHLPTLTLGLRNFAAEPPPGGWGHLVELARRAEEAGIDRVIVVDHVVMGENIDAYDGGTFPTGPDGQWLEPLTVLGVLAGATRRVRLSTGVLIAPLRRPVVLAKAAATLDVLSGGRLDLGVGVGWQREEYEAAGLAFEDRGRLLDETLEVCRTLWRPGPASHAVGDARLGSVWCEPKPAQLGGVPIWVGGTLHRRNLERIVRFADGWIPWGAYIGDVARGIDELRAALVAAGRDPAGFQVRTGLPVPVVEGRADLDAGLAPVPALVAAGVTDFSLGIRLPAAEEGAAEVLAQVVKGFRDVTGREDPLY